MFKGRILVGHAITNDEKVSKQRSNLYLEIVPEPLINAITVDFTDYFTF